MSIAAGAGNRSTASQLSSKGLLRVSIYTHFYALLISDHSLVQSLHPFLLEVLVRRNLSRPFFQWFHVLFNGMQHKNPKIYYLYFLNL